MQRGKRGLVEEHLKECEACKTLLSEIDEELARPRADSEEAKPLKAIRSAWKKSNKTAFIRGTLIAVIICAVLVGGYVGLTQWKIIPVSTDVLKVSDICRLSDGSVAFHLFVNDDKYLYFIKATTTEDGSFYMTPMRSVIEDKRTTDVGPFNKYFMLYIPEDDAGGQYQGNAVLLSSDVTSVYLGPVGDGIIIWEKGMEIPTASEELEQMMSGE
jgi:hypothetical protein